MSVQPTLIGREAEIAVVRTALNRTAAGRGASLLVVGEGGGGKTALLEQCVEQARTAGMRTAWVTAPDAEGAPAFWPWIALLQELDDASSTTEVAAALAALTTPRQEATSSNQERFALFNLVVRALRTRAAPTLLVIDDLHRADGGTLRLLEFVAPQLRWSPLVLAVGARPPTSAGADLAETFGALSHAGAVRIDLQPWSQRDIALALQQLGLPTTGPQLDELQRRTGGNPFFVLELARSAQHLSARPDLARVPPTVIDVLAAEARWLDPAQLDLLRLAATWGQGAPLTLLVAAAGLAAGTPIPSLPERFLVVDQAGAVRFRHDLVREAVYQGVPNQLRAGLHARLADATERSSLAPEVRTRQLAVHGCRAGPIWEPETAFAAALAAARDANALHAVEAAVTYLELAHQVRRWCRPDAARDLVFLCTFGESLTRIGARDRAAPVLAEAHTAARQADDPYALARIALIIGLGTESVATPNREATQRLDEALTCLPADAHQLRAQILARQTWQALAVPDLARATRCAEAAVVAARAAGEPAVLARALSAAFATTPTQDASQREQIAREMTAQAELARDIDLLFSGLLWDAHARLESGDIAAAREVARRYQETAERWPMPYHAWYRWILEASLALLDDRLEAAAAALAALDQEGTSQGQFAALLRATQEMELAARQGDRPTFVSASETVLAGLGPIPAARALRAHVDACLGQDEAARQALAQVVAGLPQGSRDGNWVVELTEAALAAVRLEARSAARRLYDELLPFRARWIVIGNATVSRGPVSGVLAGLARLLGDTQAAAVLAAEAQADARRAGTPGALFWSRGGPRWQVDQGRPPAASGLTAREREVLALLATGCSNQAIADRLVLSIRTVQRHVENIYAKTGANGRAAASVFAATHDLLPPAT